VVNDATFFLSHRLSIAQAACREGWDVAVVTPPGPAVVEIERQGLRHYSVPLSRSGIRFDQEILSITNLYRLYRRLKPDIVHHVTIKPVLYGGLAARFAGVPAVVTAISGLGSVFSGSDTRSRLLRLFIKRLYRVVIRHPITRVIVQNPEDRSHILAMGAAVPADTVLIRGSGVDLQQFYPQPEPPGIPIALMAARMLRDKGVEVFVQASRLLKQRGCSLRCALAGDPDPGNPDSISKDQLQSWHDAGHIEWWGRQNDMPSTLAAAHIICLPTHYGEGVPKVLLEGAACGRPLIATDAPGCREVVIPEVNGLLIPTRNPVALADALERMSKDPSLRIRMGVESRKMAEAAFGLDQVVQTHMTIYRELLSQAAAKKTLCPSSENNA
jgi:glycosyltransferase involved in cell wall biosynthesis